MARLIENSDETHVSRAINAVAAHIRAERMKVGDNLPGEAHFSKVLGVSRAVMREAFGALSALKLLDVGNGRRARVGAIDGSIIAAALQHGLNTSQISIADVWDVRRTIERRTAILAAENRTSEEAAEIVRLAQMIQLERENPDEITDNDIAFHKAIAAASHNALFVQIVASFTPLMEVAVPAAWHTRKTPQERETVAEHHWALAEAIASGDVEAAGKAMDRHFDSSIRDVFAAMSNQL